MAMKSMLSGIVRQRLAAQLLTAEGIHLILFSAMLSESWKLRMPVSTPLSVPASAC